VHPFVGLSSARSPPDCARRARQFVGGFIASFIFAEIISLGGLFSDLEWGYVLTSPSSSPGCSSGRRPVREALMNARYAGWAVALAAPIALPFVYRSPHLHILVWLI
jgi:hypothetical protein